MSCAIIVEQHTRSRKDTAGSGQIRSPLFSFSSRCGRPGQGRIASLRRFPCAAELPSSPGGAVKKSHDTRVHRRALPATAGSVKRLSLRQSHPRAVSQAAPHHGELFPQQRIHLSRITFSMSVKASKGSSSIRRIYLLYLAPFSEVFKLFSKFLMPAWILCEIVAQPTPSAAAISVMLMPMKK